MRTPCAWLTTLALGLTIGCAPDVPTGTVIRGPLATITSGCDPTLPPPGLTHTSQKQTVENNSDGEGEIFGGIYVNGERACGDTLEIKLVPSFSISGYDSVLTATSAYRYMWEFWDSNADDGPCNPRNLYTERGHPAAGQDISPHTYEAHCVTGQGKWFTFTGPGRTSTPRTFPVDYLGTIGSVWDTDSGPVPAQVAAMSHESPDGVYFDLAINTDLGMTTYTETPRLAIDYTTSPSTSAFAAADSLRADASNTFRFKVYRSSSDWSTSDEMKHGTVLARLYYNAGSGWVPMTNYFDFHNEVRWLRQYKFAGPSSCPGERNYTIGLELLRPDEYPANAPSSADSAQKVITVTCTGSGGVASPSGIGSSNVTTTSGRISWTNGTTAGGTTTTVQIKPASGSYTTVSSGIAAGVDTITATGLGHSTSYTVRVRHMLAGDSSSWVESTNLFTTVPAAPSSIGASSITSTTATVSWTNGSTVTGVSTEVYVKSAGGSYPSTPITVGAGTSSTGLTSLSPSTSYSVKLRHVLGGSSSDYAESLNLFTTDAPSITITGFTSPSCNRWYSGGKWRINHELAWSISGSASGLAWQLLEAASSDTTSGVIINSNTTGTSATSPTFLEYLAPIYRYYWVRYEGATGWYALQSNPLEGTSCAN